MQDELALMGLEVTSKQGSKEDAETASAGNTARVTLFLDASGASMWVSSQESAAEPASEPTTIERTDDESSELLALRLAELVRGRLLPSSSSGEAPSTQSDEDSLPRRWLSLSTGPALLVRSYAKASPAWSGDAAFWFGRVGVGAYFAVPFSSSEWTATGAVMSLRQTNYGLLGLYSLYRKANRALEVDAILRVGWSSLSIHTDSGPRAERYEGSALFFTGEVGGQATLAATPWLHLGVQLVGGFSAPVKWDVSNGRDLPEQAAAADGVVPEPASQAQLTSGFIASVRF